MIRAVLVVVGLCACTVAEAQDKASWHFRAAWNKRAAEIETVQYLTSAKLTWWTTAAGRRVSQEAALQLEARLDGGERKLRVDVSAHGRDGNLYILDGREFHSCSRLPGEAWRVSSIRQYGTILAARHGTRNLDFDWPLFYPFLLAHGIVPVPPLSVPPSRGELADDELWREQADVANGETTFAFGGEPAFSTTIRHDRNDLITRYRAAYDARPLFDIETTYRRDGGLQRLDRFVVTRFAENGQPVQRLDAQVTQFRAGVPLAAELFVPPEGAQLGEKLSGLLDDKIDVKLEMSLDDIQRTLQAAFGRGVKVEVDRDAFANDRRFANTDRLMFEPGKATLTEFLLNDLPRKLLDFYFDQGTLVIIPNSKAWKVAQTVGYSPADYGLTLEELREVLYQTGRHSDWAEIGGGATIAIDEEADRVNVFHTQSQHLRFMQRLSELSE